MKAFALITVFVLISCGLTVPPLASAQTNHPPVPAAAVENDLGNGEYPTLLGVISPDGLSAAVVFDASASSDPDGDLLRFTWGEIDKGTFHPFAEGIRVTNVFAASSGYGLGLAVSDGASSTIIRFGLRVWTPAQVVDGWLIDALKDGAQPGRPKQSLLGPLEQALSSFENGDFGRALHFVSVFQQKSRVQQVTPDGDRAEEVERATQLLLDIVIGD